MPDIAPPRRRPGRLQTGSPAVALFVALIVGCTDAAPRLSKVDPETAQPAESFFLDCTFDGNPHDARVALEFIAKPGGKADYYGRLEGYSGATTMVSDSALAFRFDTGEVAEYLIRVNRYTREAVRWLALLDDEGQRVQTIDQTTGTCVPLRSETQNR